MSRSFLNEIKEFKFRSRKSKKPTRPYRLQPFELLHELKRQYRHDYDPDEYGPRPPNELRVLTIRVGINKRRNALRIRRAVRLYLKTHDTIILTFKVEGIYRALGGKNPVPTVFTKNTPFKDYLKVSKALEWLQTKRREYSMHQSVKLQLVSLPTANPEIKGYRDGDYNCGCLPVLEHLKKSSSKKSQLAIIRVEKLNKEYFETGIDSIGLTRLAKTAMVRISVVDMSGKVWKVYNDNKRLKTLIFQADHGHFRLVSAAEAHHVNIDLFNNQLVEWKEEDYDYTRLQNKLQQFNTVRSKTGAIALITPDVIYKNKFHEYEKYPKAFTDAGVGKAKFLEQHPMLRTGLKKSDKFYDIYFDADTPGFQTRNTYSNGMNKKFDVNHAYKSFKKSGLFKGFPVLDGVFVVDKKVSQFTDWEHHGMLYIEAPDVLKPYDPLYYEGPNWYPIEIVKHLYDKYQIDPVIRRFAYASVCFDVDFKDFTNSQFRNFIGKCTVKNSTQEWKTSDKSEYLRALYILRDKVVGVRSDPYTVEYKTDKQPWQMPILSVYTKAHQKLQLFEQYNKCLSNNIKPVSVNTDSIEINHKDIEKALPLFDMGTSPGQYKIEEMGYIENYDDHEKFIKRYDAPVMPDAMAYDASYILPRLVHFSGAGGNGKTEKLIQLKKVYPNMLICAPEHSVADTINTRGNDYGLALTATTYHKVFGIGVQVKDKKSSPPSLIPHGIRQLAIDECSKVPVEHLCIINQKLQEHCNNKRSFGGIQVILFGDFCQLPPIEPLQPLFNTWTGIKHPLYKEFKEIELVENWRQKNDPTYFKLCSSIRGKITASDAKQIIQELNCRVQPFLTEQPDYNTVDDVYIAGTNDQINKINRVPLTVDTKVICQITGYDLAKNKVPNGKIGVVHQEKPFQIRWNDNKVSEFLSKGENKKGKSKFVPALALTVHKAQGKTFKRHVIINATRLFARNHLYVALTRATSFDSVYLTAPITFDMFCKTVFVENHTREIKSTRLHKMVYKYIREEPLLTHEFLHDMRQRQLNRCCYCKVPMTDEYGHNESITLERIDDDIPHIISNLKLACFKCNSAHVKV